MCANKKIFLREMPILDEPEQRWNTDLTDETDRTDFYRRESSHLFFNFGKEPDYERKIFHNRLKTRVSIGFDPSNLLDPCSII